MHDTVISKGREIRLDDFKKLHERFFTFILEETKINWAGDTVDERVNGVESRKLSWNNSVRAIREQLRCKRRFELHVRR